MRLKPSKTIKGESSEDKCENFGLSLTVGEDEKVRFWAFWRLMDEKIGRQSQRRVNGKEKVRISSTYSVSEIMGFLPSISL